MSKPSRRGRPPEVVRKPANTRRSQQRARRQRARRWRWTIGGGFTAAVAVAVALGLAASSRTPSRPPAAAVGAPAPDGVFSTTRGATETVASLRGRPTLLWFVSTWCPSCQAGTQAMAAQIGRLSAMHVRVVELELAGDLGQAGPTIETFGRQLAGAAYADPDWIFGVASTGLTTTYDPASDLDIYYLIDSSGRIRDVGSSPAATMSQLLSHAAGLT
jgi:thiol-disulfide isomerase/thioredoxin